MSESRDKLRSALLAAKKTHRKRKEITILGQKVELIQPTLAQIRTLGEDSKDDTPTIVKVLTNFVVVPGSMETIFDQDDVNELLELPTGEWIEEIDAAFGELTGVKIKDEEKNSLATAIDSPS